MIFPFTPAELKRLPALRKEANEAGFNEVGIYMHWLERQVLAYRNPKDGATNTREGCRCTNRSGGSIHGESSGPEWPQPTKSTQKGGEAYPEVHQGRHEAGRAENGEDAGIQGLEEEVAKGGTLL